jgi:DNA-binding HxlR family transcriptional regulator
LCSAVDVLPKTYAGQGDCSIARALEIVGERWTLLILRDAFFGVRRFNDFHAHLDAPRTVLSTRLQGLVDTGMLERRPDPQHAGRMLYELTPAGRALWPALYALGAWGARYACGGDGPRVFFRHEVCGQPLADTARCEICGRVPDPSELSINPVSPAIPPARRDPVARGLARPHRLLDPLPPVAAGIR